MNSRRVIKPFEDTDWENALNGLQRQHEDPWRQIPHGSPLAPSVTEPHGFNIERGSSSIPLIEQGRKQIEAVGKKLASHGKVSAIYAPDLPRTIETAQILSRETKAPIEDISSDWQTQRMGWMEGLPADEIRPEKLRLREVAPDEVPPGFGPFSTQPGESTNQFLHRWLPKLDKLQKAYKREFAKNPKLVWILVNHYSGIKAVQAWKKAGMPKDYSIDTPEFLRHDGEPGDIHRLYLGPHEEWHMEDDYKVKGPLAPGIYILRHGLTAWNAEAKPEGEKKEEAKPKVPLVSDGGLSRDEQSQLLAHLQELPRIPGYSRLPSAHRTRLQASRQLLEQRLGKQESSKGALAS